MATKVNANPTKDFFISMLTRDIDISTLAITKILFKLLIIVAV